MKTKRFLAFILTIMMIGGLLPTVFAEDAVDTGYNPVYNFTKQAYNCSDNYYTVGATNYTLDLSQSAKYEFVKNINSKSLLMSNDGIMPYTDVEANYGKTALIFKGYADYAGVYDVTVNYTRFKYSGKIGLYFVPAEYATAKWGDISGISDIAPIIEDENTIKVMDKVESNLQELNPASNENMRADSYLASGIVLPEKEFYIFIVVNKSDYKTNDGARYYSVVKNISFDSKATINVSGAKAKIKPGESTQLAVSVTDDNGGAVSDAEITYTSSDESVIKVSSTGLVEAIDRGNAVITVSAKSGDVTVSEKLYVNCDVVWNPKYVFNNSVFNTNTIGTNLFAANSFDYVKEDVSAPWCIVANHNMTNKYIDSTTAFFCTDPINRYPENAVVMKIKVDAAGIYQPSLTFKKTSENGKLDLYFISAKDTAGLSFSTMESTKEIIAKSRLGLSVDQSVNAPATSPVTGNSIYLPAGENYIIMKTSKGVDNTSNKSGYYYCYFSSLTLTHVEGISVDMPNRNIRVGKTATLSTIALDADGKALSGEVVYESSAPGIAKIDGNVVTGVDIGSTTITATLPGTSYSDTIDVNVFSVWDPKFSFTHGAVATLKDGSPATSAAVNLANLGTLKESVSTGTWKYVNIVKYYGEGLYNDGLQFSVKEVNLGQNAAIMELEIDKPGTFDTSLAYNKASYCGGLEVYIVPKSYADSKWKMTSDALDVATVIADPGVTCIADVDAHSASSDVSPATATGVKFDERNVYILFVVKNTDAGTITDDKTRLWGYPKDLTLTKTADVVATSSATTLEIGETATVSASAKDNRDNAISAEITFESLNPTIATVSGNTVTAKGEGVATIKATATIGGVTVSDTVTINVTPKKISVATDICGDIPVTSYVMGTNVTVTAPEFSGKVFRHWVLGTAENGIPVSTSASYTFKAVTNTYLTAIYSDEVAADAKVVEFYLENGGYVGSAVANEAGKVVLPDNPVLTGYVFSNWMTDAKTIFDAETVVTDLLTKVVGTFKAQMVGEKSYGEAVENKADSAKLWKRDGKVVAYGTDYTYYVWGESEITSEDGEKPTKPIIVLDAKGKAGNARMIEYDANGFEIIEAGILFGNGTEMTVDSCMYKAKSKLNKNHGQLTAKPANDSYTVARGYIVYKENDEYKVVYSD